MFYVTLAIVFIIVVFFLAYDEVQTAKRQPKSPKAIDSPRFTVEIETATIDIQQPEKKLPAKMIERGWIDPILVADTVLRIYVRDTKQSYYTNRDAKPFAQISLSDPDFDTKSMRAKAQAEERASTLEELCQ